MLTGTISDDLQAWVVVEILSPNGQSLSVEVVLDTGFNGQLALPAATIQRLGLPEHIQVPAFLAAGDRVNLMSYRGAVLWDGQPLPVRVVEADGEPLLGMELLQGSRVTLDVRDGGPVTIDALP